MVTNDFSNAVPAREDDSVNTGGWSSHGSPPPRRVSYSPRHGRPVCAFIDLENGWRITSAFDDGRTTEFTDLKGLRDLRAIVESYDGASGTPSRFRPFDHYRSDSKPISRSIAPTEAQELSADSPRANLFRALVLLGDTKEGGAQEHERVSRRRESCSVHYMLGAHDDRPDADAVTLALCEVDRLKRIGTQAARAEARSILDYLTFDGAAKCNGRRFFKRALKAARDREEGDRNNYLNEESAKLPRRSFDVPAPKAEAVVRKRIHFALKRLAKDLPGLADHFKAALDLTGREWLYDPSSPVTWSFVEVDGDQGTP